MRFDVLMQTRKEQINILTDLKCSKNSFTEHVQQFISYISTYKLKHYTTFNSGLVFLHTEKL